MITEQQLASYHRDGFLVIESAFDAGEVARMRDEADFILELCINSSVHHGRVSGRLDICRYGAGLMVRKIQPINDLSLFLTRVAENERLLGPMRAMMEDDPVLMEEKLNGKQPLPEAPPGLEPPRDDSRFPVHNDWAYYSTQGYPQSIISSAITIDACTPDSGPLRVWPGSHLRHLEHETVEGLGLQVREGLIDFEGGKDVLAPPGSVLFFHSLLVHNSRPNVSGRPRRLMIYSHYPKSARMGHDVRNGPIRLGEAPYEFSYLRELAAGRATAAFRAPRADVIVSA